MKKKWFRKNKAEQEIQEQPEEIKELVQTSLEKQEINTNNPAERKNYVTENCEQIIETAKQTEEIHREYDAVSSYLNDIQLIDNMPEGSRKEVDESARKIVQLTRERAKFQNGESKISKKQYKMIETFEDEIPDEVRKINEKEAYMKVLKKDLAALEGEKKTLMYNQAKIVDKQLYLKRMSKVFSVLSAVLFVLILALTYAFEYNPRVPFLLSVVFVLVVVALVVNEVRRNKVDMVMTERKLNKAVGLLNKVKIKYVNNQCSLDYSYAKFEVDSSAKLTFLWEEYTKQKEMERKYKDNTELLNYYTEKLVKDLKEYRIKDCEVWTHQCIALIDNKEMVEIRHRLNVRRQKLRDRLDYNNRMKEECIKNIKQVITENPKAKEEIVAVMQKYKLTL